MASYPQWLIVISWGSLLLAFTACAWIVLDIARGHRQHMWIMNLVWPLTALYAGPVALLAYYRVGRKATHQAMHAARERGEELPSRQKPFWQSVAVGSTHCGAGCTLGDICAEWFVYFVPVTLFGMHIFGAWAVDFVLAFLFGIAFQYFSIKPMRELSPAEGLKQALKADSLSLISWQVGMYGWMAVATFLIFGQEMAKTTPVFWFMMQLAMFAGFATSYPVNWWLLRRGIKEEM